MWILRVWSLVLMLLLVVELAGIQELAGTQEPDFVELNNEAIQLYQRGAYREASLLYEKAVEVARQKWGEEHRATLAVMNKLADTLYAKGDLAAARELLEQILTVSRRVLGREHPETLVSMNNLALTVRDQGDQATARELLEQVLVARRGVLGEEHPETLMSMNNLAQTLQNQGDLAASRELFEQVLGVRRRVLGEEHPDTLISMNNLALTLFAQQDLAASREILEQVLAVSRRVFGEEHPKTLSSMNSLALTLKDQGDLAASCELLEQALAVSRRVFGEKHPKTLTLMGNLAGTLHNLGALARARKLSQDVIAHWEDISEPGRRPNPFEKAINFINLALINRDAKRFDDARVFFLRALDAIEAQTHIVDLTEDVKSRFRLQFIPIYREAIATSIALKRQEEGFSITERYRAQSLLTLLGDENLATPSKIPPELKSERQHISALYEAKFHEVDNLKSNGGTPTELEKGEKELSILRRERDVTDARIRRADRADGGQPLGPLPFEKIRQSLDPGTLLISYSIAEKGLHIFLLSKEGDLEIRHVDIQEIKLRLQVEIFRDQIREKESSEARNRVAGWLYEKLLEPIADHIEASDRLVILPDGPLHYLPFSALTRPTGEDGWQYLVEWKPLHLAASATVYAELRKHRPAHDSSDTRTWELVAFGDPAYPGENGEARAADLPTAVRSAKERGLFDGLTRLPSTNREVREIRGLFPPETVRTYLRGDAREERAKAEAGKARILHFATHGFADPEVPLDSFLALTIPALDEKADDNGILQAWEILRSRLDVDLVVLSACKTAFGPDRGGEGLMSLSRAFQIAGARTVAASLWRVNDLSTSELMIRFYRHLRHGKSKDEALQAAQLELIRGPIKTVDDDGNPIERDFTAPYHWAAFQLIGDWQ